MNSTWDLSVLYDSFESDGFRSDMKELDSLIDKTVEFGKAAANMSAKELLLKYVQPEAYLHAGAVFSGSGGQCPRFLP